MIVIIIVYWLGSYDIATLPSTLSEIVLLCVYISAAEAITHLHPQWPQHHGTRLLQVGA